MTIWANTLVQNEDLYIWYAVTSVIDYVDKMLIWDTGSTDYTVEIINKLISEFPNKIIFKEVGKVDPLKFTTTRNEMLKETNADWIMVLDGDEVWWNDSIQDLISVINYEGEKLDSIISRYLNLVGDIYHYQPDNAGKYRIKGKHGFLTIRAINKIKIKGLNVDKPHGQQGFYDGNGKLIQDRNESGMYFLDNPSFLHFTNIQRSKIRVDDLKVPKRGFKLKHEIGCDFPKDFYYPEVFFRKRPALVDDVWRRMDNNFYLRSMIETPLRKLKRTLLEGKSGY
jgi:glycosyltransferase involved in cell wall biosynthesis